MRLANHGGRLVFVASEADGQLHGARAIDVHRASGGTIPAEPELAYEHWDAVVRLANGSSDDAAVTIDREQLGSPSPRPRQIFGVGVNYADHGAEADMAVPEVPLIFTKLSTAITGPYGPITLSTNTVDWEVEIAVVIGRRGRDVAASAAWDHVAGVTAAQDLSDRDIQWRPQATPQFGLGKSLAGFAPLGPVLVTPDEYPDPDDIELACLLNGEEVQRSRSSQMLLSVPEIISYLSGILTLCPGDVILTGTPGGIGMTRTPPRYLEAGDTLESFVAGVGSMSHTFTATKAAKQPQRP
jgi:2-keto-4-pentenoate hydratase/2-oxohepta-3-ene-1,7-dioic acid hydratase in catechol pathway